MDVILQVPKWSRQQLVDFWKKWYFPGNATLYLVGNFDRPVEQLPDLIKEVFGNVAPAYQMVEAPPAQQPAAGLNGNGTVSLPQPSSNGQAQSGASTALVQGPRRERTLVSALSVDLSTGPICGSALPKQGDDALFFVQWLSGLASLASWRLMACKPHFM